MRINVIDKLRKYDAAIMELGLEYSDKMAIPPGQLAFPLSGYCIAECTEIVRRQRETPLLKSLKVPFQFLGTTKIWHGRVRIPTAHSLARC